MHVPLLADLSIFLNGKTKYHKNVIFKTILINVLMRYLGEAI